MFDGLRADIKALRTEIADLRVRKDVLKREIELSDEVVGLKRQISELEIKKGQMKEQHDKEDRELRHMIGLEKKRQEFEIDSAKRDTGLTVREENLAADKKRFEEQMKFQTDRFEKEVVYLKDMIGEILERLPTVTVDKTLTNGGRRG